MTTELKRKTTDFEKDVLSFLNDLRESGITNMFGAAPYIQDEFCCDIKEARRLLSLWMRNFNSEGNYEEVKE